MIKNLLASALLMAASTSVLAGDLADSLNADGAISSDVVSAALANCADADCKSDVLAEAIAAGIDAASVMSIALAADIDANDIASALRSANVSDSDIVAAALVNNQDPAAFITATATGNSQNNSNASTRGRVRIPVAAVPNGISPATPGDAPRAPVFDFDDPGLSIGSDNSIEFD
ncbi:MAG: hypothetical protein ACI978_001961 [Oleispira sp.]|jgi:hypothetical protein